MSDVAATLRPRTDILDAARRAPAADTRPEPGLLEQAAASIRAEADRSEPLQLLRIREAYEPIIDALRERGVEEERLTLGGEVIDDTFGSIATFRRARDGEYFWQLAQEFGLEGLPATREEFERQAVRRGDERSRDQDVMARGEGLDAWLAQFAGGMVGSFADPVNIATLPLGGGGRTALARIASEAAVGAGIETVQAITQNRRSYARLGEEYGLAEAAQDIALAGAGAGAMRGAFEIAPPAARMVGDRLAPIRQRFAEYNQLRNMARALGDAEPPEGLSAEQRAALAILRREDDIDAVSPYARTIEGDELHRARLEEAQRDIAAGRPPREFGPPDFEAVKAAIRGPESGGDDAVTNRAGSSAAGRYQFIRGTFKTLYREEFGVDDAAAEAAWANRRFDADVQERLMDRLLRQNARVLQDAGLEPSTGNLYLAHFAGAGRAARLLRSPPDAPVSRFFTPVEIAQNSTYLGGGKSVSEAIAIIHSRVGDTPGTVRPAQPDPFASAEDATSAELAGIAAEEAEIEALRVQAEQQANAIAPAMRRMLDEPGVRLNDTEALATQLEVDHDALRRALTNMGLSGELELVLPRSQRRRIPVATRARGPKTIDGREVLDRFRSETNEEIVAANGGIWPGTFRRRATLPQHDVFAYLAANGGLDPTGYSGSRRQAALEMLEADKAAGRKPRPGALGHDLRNTGYLDKKIPRYDPLIRNGGRSLEEVGELLLSGQFTTHRLTEREVIEFLDAAARSPEKTYALGERPPEQTGSAPKEWRTPEEIAAEEALLRREDMARENEADDFEERRAKEFIDELARDNAALRDDPMAELLKYDAAYLLEEARFMGRPITAENALSRAMIEHYDRLKLQAEQELDNADYIPGFDEEADANLGRAEGDGWDEWEPEGDAGGPAPVAEPAGRSGDAGGAGGQDRPPEGPQGGLTEAQRDIAADGRQGPPPDPDNFTAFDDPAGEGAQVAGDSAWHDIEAARGEGNAEAPPVTPAQMADRVEAWLQENGWQQNNQYSFSRRIEGYADAGSVSSGRRNVTLNINWAKARVERVDGWGIVEETIGFDRLQGDLASGLDWLTYKGSLLEKQAEPPAPAQADFAAPTPEQARIALERQMEGRKKGTVPQKPAGSDGGLFDANGGRGDTTGDLFDPNDTFDLGDGKGPRTLSDIQTEIERDRAAIDAIRDCME